MRDWRWWCCEPKQFLGLAVVVLVLVVLAIVESARSGQVGSGRVGRLGLGRSGRVGSGRVESGPGHSRVGLVWAQSHFMLCRQTATKQHMMCMAKGLALNFVLPCRLCDRYRNHFRPLWIETVRRLVWECAIGIPSRMCELDVFQGAHRVA